MKNSPVYKTCPVKLLLLLCISIGCFVWPEPAYASKILKVVILPYKNLDSDLKLNWLGEGLAQYLAYKFDRYTSITPVERYKLLYLIHTQQVTELATTNSGEVQKIGKLTGAQLIVYGDYRQRDELIINTHLMEVRSGKDWGSFKNYGQFNEILNWQAQIMLNLLEKIKFELTPQAKQAISSKTTTSLAAYKNYIMAKTMFLDGETEKVVSLCKKAIGLDPKFSQAVGLLIKAYELRNQWENTLDLYQKYETLLYENQNWRELNGVYDIIITIYTNNAEFKLTLKYYGKKLALAKKKGDLAGVSSIYAKVAVLYRRKNKLDKAISYFQKVLKLQEKIGDQSVIGNTHTDLGDVYFTKKSYDNALKNYHKGLGIWRLRNDKGNSAIILSRIGKVLSRQNKCDEALNYFEQALSIQQMSGNKNKAADVYSNMGEMYKEQSLFSTAMDYYQKATHIYEKEDDKAGIIAVYDKIGNLLMQRNQLDDALEIYRKALDIHEKINDFKLPHTYSKIGDIYLAKKNHLEALKYYLKSKELYQIDDDKVNQADTYYRIGGVYDKMNRYDKAIDYIERTVKIERELNAPGLKEHLDYLNQLKQKLIRN